MWRALWDHCSPVHLLEVHWKDTKEEEHDVVGVPGCQVRLTRFFAKYYQANKKIPTAGKCQQKSSLKATFIDRQRRWAGRKWVHRIHIFSSSCDGLRSKDVFKLDKPCYTLQREHASGTLGKIQLPLTINLSSELSLYPQSDTRAELKSL